MQDVLRCEECNAVREARCQAWVRDPRKVDVMGLYGFKTQFVPKILAGEKTHTIRAPRVDGLIDKPGNTMHLYTGLRQKGARLLMRPICTKVEPIEITEHGNIVVDGIMLCADEVQLLARRDGFADHAEMMTFWKGRLPFKGHIIHWKAQA